MTTLTPLRGSASKDAAKIDPALNTETTVRQAAASIPPLVAQDDEDDTDDEEDDEDKEKSQGKKTKKDKTKKAQDDKKDDDDEDKKKEDEKSRAQERHRILTILDSEPGKAIPQAAMHIALNTTLPAADAIGVLGSMQGVFAGMKAEGIRSPLATRMAAEPKYEVGLEAPALEDNRNPLATRTAADGSTVPANPSALAAAIIAAGKKRRGES